MRLRHSYEVNPIPKLALYHLDETTSTNELAKRVAGKKDKDFVIWADKQTEGKGRKERSWISPEGGLYFSLCTSLSDLLSLKASVAVVRTLNRFDIKPELKWPNDVLVKGKKICGILTEIVDDDGIVGIGLNVEKAPLEDSISLSTLVEEKISRKILMKEIVREFYELEDSDVLEIYKEYCSTIGSRVKVKTVSEEIVGKVKDIDDKGRIVMESGKKITTGDVVHLRKDD